MKALLYQKECNHLRNWKGLHEPTPKSGLQKGKLTLRDDKPNFGQYKKDKEQASFENKKNLEPNLIENNNADGVGAQPVPEDYKPEDSAAGQNRSKPAFDIPTKNIKKLSDVIGETLPKIGKYNDFDQKKDHVVAIVDPNMCINCGKCYMTCNDSGYQAITFDPVTHLPVVDPEKCTGCTLCYSVCPIIDCIDMVKREGPYKPIRGYADAAVAEIS